MSKPCECGSIFLNPQSLNAHYRWCEVRRALKGKGPAVSHLKGRSSPNKGKKLSEIVENPEMTRELLRKSRENQPPYRHTEETKRRLSASRSAFLEENPHVEWFEVGGVKVQGGWERRVAEKLLDSGIRFERKRLVWSGGRVYVPDFFLPELDLYLEVKGLYRTRDRIRYPLIVQELGIDLRIIHGRKALEDFLGGGAIEELPRILSEIS